MKYETIRFPGKVHIISYLIESEYIALCCSSLNLDKMKNPEIDTYKNKIWRNKLGQLHRIDGPAVEWANRNKEWWINNIHITKEVLNWYKELGLDTNISLTNDEQILFKLKFG